MNSDNEVVNSDYEMLDEDNGGLDNDILEESEIFNNKVDSESEENDNLKLSEEEKALLDNIPVEEDDNDIYDINFLYYIETSLTIFIWIFFVLISIILVKMMKKM